ncbi:MAG TPA: ATP-binding protein [Vicinamibacterales bacterium]|nr:ATP-binding protein [Vicinamibacterales bacterium]
MTFRIVSLTVRQEPDVVAVRQRARQIAELVGFDVQDQTRIATSVSEIARNALRYGGGGTAEFGIEGERRPQLLSIRVVDKGPGLANAEEILQGRYVSSTGMGLGIIGSRRLMDQFRIESEPGKGTTVRMAKLLPARAGLLKANDVQRIVSALALAQPQSAIDELQQQNQELIRALDELRRRQEDLARLNAELEDTNRGVVALYAELDERADSLRRADEMKSRFLSHMSHEFRTPLNSMRALSQILLDRTDGDLTSEQEIQVSLIQRAAEDLSELVNDLLDLAKVEAGKTVIRPAECDIRRLFGALRGMLKPLMPEDGVSLRFEEEPNLPTLITDESKVSQILRNFISNALKFTERGHVRVSARRGPNDTVVFEVEDSGIGIAPEDQERVFQEFSQLDNPVQKTVRGTGLGLPLSRKLAHLLGGEITLQSQVGAGSTFSLILPIVFRDVSAEAITAAPATIRSAAPARTRRRVLVVDDDDAARYLVRKWLTEANYDVIEESSGMAACAAARDHSPDVIVLDLIMPDASGFEVLQQIADETATHHIPIVIHTSMIDPPARERLGERVVEVVSKNQAIASGAAALRAAVERAIHREDVGAPWAPPS